MKTRPDQDVGIRTGTIRAPRDLPAYGVYRGKPAADSELAATVGDENFAFDDRLAHIDVAELRLPDLLPVAASTATV
jgi:hypothetical protein